MAGLEGKVAWVTGASSGIGEAAALALAQAGAIVAITARRRDRLKSVADAIATSGGRALVVDGDLVDPTTATRVVGTITQDLGRLDILINNAGVNIPERSWSKLTPERIRTVIDGNLTSAFFVAQAALSVMRAQKDGLLIHTSSWAGRFVSVMGGPAYYAAKHGVVAMSYEINMEEFANGIRSTVLCPNEVATPILDHRPIPVTEAERERMIQPAQLADLIVYLAKLPPSLCVNEVVISPTWNRAYGAGASAKHA